MAPPNLVKVLEVCKVAPTPPSPDSAAAPTSLPLTFSDVFWLRFSPTQRLFFYEAPYPTATVLDTILPKLKHSLSLTLQHYLPLAGNLMWPPHSDKPIIQYTQGDAVSLTVAESEDADHFYHLSSDTFREAKEFHPFLPNLPACETRVPAMALQVTLFPKAGFSIGHAAHHAVLDGKTIYMFMHSWASICKRGGDSALPPELTPFYDRTIINDPYDLEKTYLNGWMEQSGPNNKSLMFFDLKAPPDTMIGTFQLTQENVKSIIKRVEAQWQEKHKQEVAIRVSTFAITTAYVWVCLMKVRKLGTQRVQLVVPVDCRARLEPPVPSTYFGTCLAGFVVDADSNELMGEDGVAIAAKAIGEGIRGLDDGVLKGAKDLIFKLFSLKTGDLFSIAGSPRFQFYDTDFGWGRPRKVELVSIDKSGAFSLSESKESNGAVEIGIALKKHETEAFASLFATGLETR